MPNYYAQIDAEGRVEGLSELSGEVLSELLVPIDEELYRNPNLMFTRYVNGAFEGVHSEITADKTMITGDGKDVLTLQIAVFDWKNQLLREFNKPILVEVGGIQQQVKSSEGVAEITITSDESGEFRVRTLGLDRNSELKVVVKSGN
ncbi:hypothetical protein D3C87_451840 [compost metagenome]